MTKTFEAQNSLGSYTLYGNLLALNLQSTFCTRKEHRHLRGVHYLELTGVLNYEAPNAH